MPRCPVCRVPTDLIKYEGVPIYNCGGCGGHWVTQDRLDVIVRRHEYAFPPAVKERLFALVAESNRREAVWCQGCGRRMVKEAFKHWRELQIDRCTQCGGIWLDRGELEVCQILWEHLEANPDGELAKKVERIATLDAEQDARRAELEEQRERASTARTWTWRPGGLSVAFGIAIAGLFGLGRKS